MIGKYSAEEKISAVKKYLSGITSQGRIADELGINLSSFQKWIMKYESMGEEAFIRTGYKHYSKELKENAVSDYLNGKGSQADICKKYKIHSQKQLQSWIKKYNGHEKLKVSGTGGTAIMTDGRKTTFNERVKIAAYCIAHDHNYAETAKEFNVSYQQARNYTVKYEKGGVDALQDRRGKKKNADTDSMSEVDKLRAELELEKAKRKQAEMENALLKKMKELERRWL